MDVDPARDPVSAGQAAHTELFMKKSGGHWQSKSNVEPKAAEARDGHAKQFP